MFITNSVVNLNLSRYCTVLCNKIRFYYEWSASWIGVWIVAQSASRISPTTEGREDVRVLTVGYCRSGATRSEWAGGKVRVHHE